MPHPLEIRESTHLKQAFIGRIFGFVPKLWRTVQTLMLPVILGTAFLPRKVPEGRSLMLSGSFVPFESGFLPTTRSFLQHTGQI